MKYSYLIIAVLFCSSINAQDKLFDILPMQNGKVIYTNVTNLDSANKNALYGHAKKWFAETYKSAQNVIQLDDKDNGQIVGKGLFKSAFQVFMEYQTVNVYHTVNIYVKDNKYKYEITDFKIQFHVPASQYNAASDYEGSLEDFVKGRNKNNMHKMCADIDLQVQAMVISLQKEMTSKVDENW